jgi:hypothetical protein
MIDPPFLQNRNAASMRRRERRFSLPRGPGRRRIAVSWRQWRGLVGLRGADAQAHDGEALRAAHLVAARGFVKVQDLTAPASAATHGKLSEG